MSMIGDSVADGSYVRAAIGCPLQCYSLKTERKEYLDYILPQGKVEIELNGIRKRFVIDRRAVFAEGYGPLLLFPERFMNRTVGVIDIGGFNVNGCYFLNGRLIPEANITNQLGKYKLMSSLVQPLNRLAPAADFHIYEIEELYQDEPHQDLERHIISRELVTTGYYHFVRFHQVMQMADLLWRHCIAFGGAD